MTSLFHEATYEQCAKRQRRSVFGVAVRYVGMPIGTSGVKNATTALADAAKELWKDAGVVDPAFAQCDQSGPRGGDDSGWPCASERDTRPGRREARRQSQ